MVGGKTADHGSMKSFALSVRHALLVTLALSASAFGQLPNPRPTTPPAPRRNPLVQPRGNNQLKKLAPKNKVAASAKGKRGVGASKRGAKKLAGK